LCTIKQPSFTDPGPADRNLRYHRRVCEITYEKYPSLEFINEEIVKVLGDIRALLLQIGLAAGQGEKEHLTRELKAMLQTLPAPSL